MLMPTRVLLDPSPFTQSYTKNRESGSGNRSPLVKKFHAVPNNKDLEFLKSSSAQSHTALLISLGGPFPLSLSVT